MPDTSKLDAAGTAAPSLTAARHWHDPLRLLESTEPSASGRIVLWTVSILVALLIAWSAFGQLDIVASADGKLVPQTLVKIVQPSESGVVKALLVAEGQSVKAGQPLAQLDSTLAAADRSSARADLVRQQMQARRIEAELAGLPLRTHAGDDPQLYTQVAAQFSAHRKAYLDSLEQEKAVLAKTEHEQRSARETLTKLEQTLPIYRTAADNMASLAQEGYVPAARSDEKRRDAIERARDVDAQRSALAALAASVAAQRLKVEQLQSSYRSELEKELADVRGRVGQLQPMLDKSVYKEGQMVLRAPQDGMIKDLATTTVGAVVQPGTVLLTLVPQDEQLYADVRIRNEDAGFVAVGQRAQVKVATYPFQRYGMLAGTVVLVSADASEANAGAARPGADGAAPVPEMASYKARVRLDRQELIDPYGNRLRIGAGMQVVAEINQGKRTVLEYLLSPVRKAMAEAARER